MITVQNFNRKNAHILAKYFVKYAKEKGMIIELSNSPVTYGCVVYKSRENFKQLNMQTYIVKDEKNLLFIKKLNITEIKKVFDKILKFVINFKSAKMYLYAILVYQRADYLDYTIAVRFGALDKEGDVI